MGRVARIASVVGLVAVLAGLPAPAPALAESPIHPENRPSSLDGETNGHVRPEALVGVEGVCRAGRAAGPSLALMLAAARADGVALRPGDCYRPANEQSAAKSNACSKGNCACAAGTGTSMHGWGKAVDFRDAGGTLTFGSSGYRWLKANGARFGWNHARWSEPGGSECPEAWHWEFVGDGGRMQLDTIRADVVCIVAGRGGGYWGVTGLGAVAARGGATDAGSHAGQPLAWLVEGATATPSGAGYWLVASDGGVFSFGDAGFFGSTGAMRLNRPIVGMAATPSGRGYWLVASDGGIFSFGDAGFFGSTGAMRLNRPIVGMAATPSGLGYWLVASDGGIFSFGDAGFFGSTGALRLNRPIVGMAATPSGLGYWLVASDGGIFAFGDARFFGSTGAIALARPITGVAATSSGDGYWLVASDGGVFSFGDARYRGSAPERPAARPRSVVAMVASPTGAGYWQASASGERLAFGDAPDFAGPATTGRPIVGIAAAPDQRHRIDRVGDAVPVAEPTTTTTVPSVWLGPPGPPQSFASAADPTWGTSISTVEAGKAGRVLALAEAGNMVFVGGEFAGAARPGTAPDGDPACQPGANPLSGPSTCVLRPYLFALDANTGTLLDWDAHPDGAVLSLQASPDGRQLYVGGRFTTIGGAPAGNIALLDIATATQVSTFHPPTADSGIHALALHDGTLYIGGSFRRLSAGGGAGQPVTVPGVAALDAVTGEVRAGFPQAQNTGGRFVGHTGTPTEDGQPGVVYDMAVSGDGRTVYVAGDFLHFGGQGGLLALDSGTGAPAHWQPAFDRPRPAFGVTVWPGDGASVVASTGGPGGSIQFFNPAKGSSPVWVGRTDGDATDVVATTALVYGVGHWDHGVPDKNDPCLRHVPVTCLDGTPHRKLIAFDARTGVTDAAFTAQANTPQGPYVALVGAHHLYVGGDFTEVGPLGALRPQGGFAAFDQIEAPSAP